MELLFFKGIFTTTAIVLTVVAFVPYIRSILSGRTRPHVFSWIIWAGTTFVVFLAQLAADGGIGAWPIGISGVITLVVALLAYHKKADDSITAADWLFFLLALSSLPLWFVTSEPLWAVVVLTLVDLLGFGPTFRKAFHSPMNESVGFFVIMLLRNTLVVLALEQYSWTTVLFPAAVALACFALIIVIIHRRRKLWERT
ncbi:MAG: hypothetical protein OEZ68_22215 [Gammaproteobacteria bacterium]|nr:hypothetical protein [Gammaproteobacteria bacterium]MDH5803503.1 hypothetical protein [Gammaproteobacteria bacterium]